MFKKLSIIGVLASLVAALFVNISAGRQLSRLEMANLRGTDTYPETCCYINSLCCPIYPDDCSIWDEDPTTCQNTRWDIKQPSEVNCCCNSVAGGPTCTSADTNECLIEVYCTYNGAMMVCNAGVTAYTVSNVRSCVNGGNCPSPDTCDF